MPAHYPKPLNEYVRTFWIKSGAKMGVRTWLIAVARFHVGGMARGLADFLREQGIIVYAIKYHKDHPRPDWLLMVEHGKDHPKYDFIMRLVAESQAEIEQSRSRR